METWDISSLHIEAHQPQVLRTDGEARVIAIHLPAGEELQEHQVHERAYVIVVEGEAEISADGKSVQGGAGLVSHFAPNERHTVRATTDARLVLVLSPWPGEGHPSRAS
ncbi:MAG TPA: cupin domain-containing protein [Solirubrobacteraceae bacterium]|nr:cupin domain-containing protein [Solirubrobacteraceae bacterium]